MQAQTNTRGLAFVVLAAGRGARLAGQGHIEPKWLLPVAGRRIADYQLDGIGAAVQDADRLLVVTGFEAEALTVWLRNRTVPTPVEIVHNAQWSDLNNWYSLLLATERLAETGWTGGLVVLNSDLCGPARLFSTFVEAARTLESGRVSLAVDFERPLSDEAMKVGGVRGRSGRFSCSTIGKVGVTHPLGEYIGMAAFAPSEWPPLLPVLQTFAVPEHRNEWYEAGFQQLMNRRGSFEAWPTPDSTWVEIDDGNDWQRANAAMAS